jgi:hypothetical protein
MTDLKTQFDRIHSVYEALFLSAPVIEGTKWQSTKAPAPMVEIFNQSFSLYLAGVTQDNLPDAIGPNLPWADRHFEEERVSGQPINPGETWKIWPYSRSAENHLHAGQYDHSYAERYWPKHAGQTENGLVQGNDKPWTHQGIRHRYGDLNDLIQVLIDDPLTRQAYLPIFFPEDLAAATVSARVPCTLGYHFIRRNDQLHIIYPMRSCDFIRHFRDDVYLTLRLLMWVLERCKIRSPENWANVTLGTYRMHITSLHMFVPDRQALVYRRGQKS